MAVVAAVAAGIGAAAQIAGAVTRGAAQKRQVEQQEEELKIRRKILDIQAEQAEREGTRTLGRFQASAGARGARGASSEAVEGSIQAEIDAQQQIFEKQKKITSGQAEYLSGSKGLLTWSAGLEGVAAGVGGITNIYGIGYDAGWW